MCDISKSLAEHGPVEKAAERLLQRPDRAAQRDDGCGCGQRQLPLLVPLRDRGEGWVSRGILQLVPGELYLPGAVEQGECARGLAPDQQDSLLAHVCASGHLGLLHVGTECTVWSAPLNVGHLISRYF